MMRWLLATLVCLWMLGCASEQSTEDQAALSPSRPSAAVLVDGRWEGKTSQDRRIEFVVSDSSVSSLKVGVSLKLDAVCAKPGSPVATDYRGGEADVTFGKPLPVAEAKFVASLGVSDVDAQVTGEFSDGSATGTIDLQAAPSSGCSGKHRVTWSATRQKR